MGVGPGLYPSPLLQQLPRPPSIPTTAGGSLDQGSGLPPGLTSVWPVLPQVEPHATIAEIKNLFTKSRKSRARPHCLPQPFWPEVSGWDPCCQLLSPGPVEMPPEVQDFLGLPIAVPPCGHQQEHPCLVSGHPSCLCFSGLCPGATKATQALSSVGGAVGSLGPARLCAVTPHSSHRSTVVPCPPVPPPGPQ